MAPYPDRPSARRRAPAPRRPVHHGAAHGAPAPPRARPRPPYNPLQAEAKRYVDAQFLPLLAQINREFGARAKSGQAAIAGSTEALAQHLAPLAAQTHDIYAQAQASQSGVNTALANRLQGAGASLGGEIGAKLAAAGINGVPNDAAATGAGAAGAGLAMGSADLTRLISQGAAAETRMAGLPGIARLGGAQESRRYGAQLASEQATAVGDVRAKIPGTLAQILQDLKNRQFQEKALQVGVAGDVYKQSAQTQRTRIQQSNANKRAAAANTVKRESIQAANQRSGMNLKERARHNGVTEDEQRRRDIVAERQRKKKQQEQGRHNRQMEKKKSTSGSKSNPWDTP